MFTVFVITDIAYKQGVDTIFKDKRGPRGNNINFELI